MPITPNSTGSWGLCAQTQGPFQDPRYTSGASGGANPSAGPFTSDDDDDDDDDDDANWFISDSFRKDDSQQDQLFVVA